MDKVKKLFSPTSGDTYHSHQAGVPDGSYHRQSVSGAASTENQRTTSGAEPTPTSSKASDDLSTAARRDYAKPTTLTSSQPSSPRNQSTPTRKYTEPTAFPSQSTPTRKYTEATNFAADGPSYGLIPKSPSTNTTLPTPVPPTPASNTQSTPTTDFYKTTPSNNTMSSNPASKVPAGAFVDDVPTSTRSTTDGTAMDKGTDSFTPHPHTVDASNKPLAAPEDPDAVRTSEPATTIAARVMGAGGTSSYSAAPGTASTTTGHTAMPTSERSAGMGAPTTIVSGRTGDGLDPLDSGPASKTVGPHDSNFANIMDPRVKPDPSKMHGSDSPANSAAVGGAPYTNERHAERELYETEQSKGGDLGAVHKHQESKYADPLETETTARDKYYGNDGVTGAGAGAGTLPAAGAGGVAAGSSSHDHSTGKSGMTDSSQVSKEEGGRPSMDSQGRPKKRGLMDRILHR